MDTSAVQKAIEFALSGNWEEAIEANLGILENSPNDTEAFCRLARAYFETGKISDAKKITDKVLSIDPTNQIAAKFKEKLKLAKKGNVSHAPLSCNESFVEDPGKTKIISLMNLGEPENFADLDPGEEVRLTPYSYRVAINTLDGKYVGKIPDDIASRLKMLIKNGYKYQTLIKSVNTKEVSIFIREIEMGPLGLSSFPPEKIEYVSFTPPELVHKDTPSVETTEEIPEE